VIFPVNWPLLLTDRWLLLVETPPMVTLVMFSWLDQPDPVTLMDVPVGPEVGLKVAGFVITVTVKTLVYVWAPLCDPVITMV